MENDLPAPGWNLPYDVSTKDIDNLCVDDTSDLPDDWFDNADDDCDG